MLKSFLIKNATWFAWFFLVILCVFNVNTFILERKFEGDIASRMVLALGPQLGFGSPYRDLWEIIPPGYIIFLQAWATVFGSEVVAFLLLHFLSILGSAFFLILVLRKLFSSYVYWVVLICCAVVFFSPALHSMYISSEMFGAFFSLIALTCLLYVEKPAWKVGLTTAFFFIAGQMKDPFLFGILAVAPFFAWKFFTTSSFVVRRSLVGAGILGVFLPLAFFFTYLTALGAFHGYQEVLDAKTGFLSGFDVYSYTINAWRSLVYVRNMFQRQEIMVGIFIALFPLIYIAWFLRRAKLTYKKKVVTASFDLNVAHAVLSDDFFLRLGVLLFIFGSYIGMYVQGSFSTHYLIQSVVPLYIFLGLVFVITIPPLEKFLQHRFGHFISTSLLCGLCIFIMMPKSYYARSYIFNWHHGYLEKTANSVEAAKMLFSPHSDEGDAQVAMENKVKEQVADNECIIHVYGWHVSRTYLYTERKPCTRFFLINIVVKDWQRKEYRNDILTQPPKAVVYGTGGGDFEIKKFEFEVVNWSHILEQCYTVDPDFVQYHTTFPATLYWAKYGKEEMIKCVVEANIVSGL